MESWFLYVATKSIYFALFTIVIVTFLESLALVGLILPGIVLMTTLGAFIGNGKLNLYPAWAAGIFGCMCGDWISYYCGWKFKSYLNNLSFLKKNNNLLKKIKSTLNHHTIKTILIGRFIGPIRPLIPMVCGMLNISLKKFIFPNIVGCILWPLVYFFPGILAGIAIESNNYSNNIYFKIQFLLTLSLLWLGLWLLWKIWKRYNTNVQTKIYFSNITLLFLSILSLLISIINIILIQSNPQITIFRRLLWKVFISKI